MGEVPGLLQHPGTNGSRFVEELYLENRKGRRQRVRVLQRGKIGGAHDFRVHPLSRAKRKGLEETRSDGDGRQHRERHDGRRIPVENGPGYAPQPVKVKEMEECVRQVREREERRETKTGEAAKED